MGTAADSASSVGALVVASLKKSMLPSALSRELSAAALPWKCLRCCSRCFAPKWQPLVSEVNEVAIGHLPIGCRACGCGSAAVQPLRRALLALGKFSG